MGEHATWRHVSPGMPGPVTAPYASAGRRAARAPRGWATSGFAVGRRVRQSAIPTCFSSTGLRARAAAWLARRVPTESARRFMNGRRSPRGRLCLTVALGG